MMHKLIAFTSNQTQILALMFTHPGEEFSMSGIGIVIGKRPGVFQRGINSLERSGIVKSRKMGNQRLFSLNSEHPLANQIKSIVSWTAGAEGMLRSCVNGVAEIDLALIFGSYAKGGLAVGSDIDLLVVTSMAAIGDEIYDRLAAVEKKMLRDVNCKIYTRDEFDRKRRRGDPFLDTVLREPYILLKGNLT